MLELELASIAARARGAVESWLKMRLVVQEAVELLLPPDNQQAFFLD